MSKMTLKTEGDTHVVVTRRFAASPEAVYRAHTETSLIQKWLLGPDGWTMPVCINDPRPGGKFRYEWTDGKGHGFYLTGEYLELVPFRRIVHVERMHLPEANFFGIVVAIQTKSGGNLSEALGNLSRVLRDRKRMAAKIQAMSMEAKASAVIIAALPFAVMILVYITSPSYIELLWTTPMGRMMMAACVVWMLIGTMVMKKMINFDF